MPASSGTSSGNSCASQSPSPSILGILQKYKYTKKTSNEEHMKPGSMEIKQSRVENGEADANSSSGSPVFTPADRSADPCIPETPDSDIPRPVSPIILPASGQQLALGPDSDDTNSLLTGENTSKEGCGKQFNHHHTPNVSKARDKDKNGDSTDCSDNESPFPSSLVFKEQKKTFPQVNRSRRLLSSSDSEVTAIDDDVNVVSCTKPIHAVSPSESESDEDSRASVKVKLKELLNSAGNSTASGTSKKRGVMFLSDDDDDDSNNPVIANNCGDKLKKHSLTNSQPPRLKKGKFVIVSDEEECSSNSMKSEDKSSKAKENQNKKGITFISDDENSNEEFLSVQSDNDDSRSSSMVSSTVGSEKTVSDNSGDDTSEEHSSNSRNISDVRSKKKVFDVNKFKSAIANGLTTRNDRQSDRMRRQTEAELLFSGERKRSRELPVYDSDDDATTNRRDTSERMAVTSFFNSAPTEELFCIPGCKQAKLDVILKLRPFRNWKDLLRKFQSDKSLSTDMLNGAQEVMIVRSVVTGLMKRCERISSEIEQLVSSLMDGSQAGHIAEQPKVLNPNVHLASYQLLGLNWLALMHRQNLNGILADEMGLGKTVQAIAFLSHLLEEGDHGPHLIVVPSSTLENWIRELSVWCSKLNVIAYYGSQAERAQIRHEILRNRNQDFNVLVTTYNIVSSTADDKKLIKKVGFHYIIFDEAHMLKNMTSLRFKNLMKIMARRRLLLTGTPLQNNLIELMSLLIFVMPDIFYGKTEEIKQLFTRKNYNNVEATNDFERERIEHAKRIMRPFVLRRLKKDVLRDLPGKHEKIERCLLSESQRKLYDDLIASFSKQVRENQENVISNSGVGMMMQLRKMANHPLLLRNRYSEDMLRKMASLMLKEPTHSEADKNLIYEDMEVMSDFELHNLCCLYKSVADYKLDTDALLDSGKFNYLDSVLPSMKQKGNRVLLFSQFVMVLDIIEWYMKHRKYSYVRLDGQTKVDTRLKLIDRYTNESDIFIFLLSTRAGGLGINLTAADNVIIHDIDFNPYNDKQAEDRCHRIGQTKEVSVIRLVGLDTIEEGILRCALEKLKLEQDVTGAQTDSEKESKKDVATLLKTALNL